jgi:hypothetical protein
VLVFASLSTYVARAANDAATGIHSISVDPEATTTLSSTINAEVTMQTTETTRLISWQGDVQENGCFVTFDKGNWATNWQGNGMSQSFRYQDFACAGSNTWYSQINGCRWYATSEQCFPTTDAAISNSTACICIPPWPLVNPGATVGPVRSAKMHSHSDRLRATS